MKHFTLNIILTILMNMVGINSFAEFDTKTKIKVENQSL